MKKSEFIKKYAKNLNVLYVEDDPDIQNEVVKFIKPFFKKVDVASDGQEGLTLFKNNQKSFDLVITDINMPNLDGIEMSFAIKELEPEQDIIITTAYSDTEYFVRAIKLGIDAYIMKPIDAKQFINVLYKTVLKLKAKKEATSHLAKLEESIEEKTKKLEEFYNSLDDMVNKKTEEISSVNENLNELSARLSKYFSPQIYDSIFSGRQNANIESKRKKITVFFSDIKDFTQTTDELEPEELTHLLNDYLNEMSKIALEYGATIDKFIGDAMLLFFGDPVSKGIKEDAYSCVTMALHMQQKMVELRHIWQKKGITKPFHIRMGIATGYTTVGNFGSEHKIEYTIIGSIVNLANRLQSAADVDRILISQETYLLVKEKIKCNEKEMLTVKGFDKPIQSYEVISPYKKDIVEKAYDGFYIFVDYENQKEKKGAVIKLLKEILQRLDNS